LERSRAAEDVVTHRHIWIDDDLWALIEPLQPKRRGGTAGAVVDSPTLRALRGEMAGTESYRSPQGRADASVFSPTRTGLRSSRR
jgi:hypothetical protein